MKRYLQLTLLALLFSVTGQTRELNGYDDFTDYREIGDTRLWTIIVFDSVVGSLTSKVTSTKEIDGQKCYVINQILNLDYNRVGNQMKMSFNNNHYVSEAGYYMGDEMKAGFNDRVDEMVIFRKGDFIEGYQTRGDNKIEQKVKLNKNIRSIEYNFFDEFENWLASKEIRVGTIFNDTVFMPQSLSTSFIEAKVLDFRQVQLYRGVYDSCFEISYDRPLQMTQFFNTKKQLKKIIIPSQNMKVYLDKVENKDKMNAALELLKERKKAAAPNAPLGVKVLVWLVYLLIAVISLLFFFKDSYKYFIGYAAFAAGGLIFSLVPFTQIKFQNYFFNDIFVPQVINQGGSALAYGLIPALATGLIQTVLIVTALLLVFHLMDLKSRHLVALGALVGAGFGFVEAAYLTNGMYASQFFGVALIERGFTILMHVTSGAIIGFGFRTSIKLMTLTALAALGVNAFIRYLPVFIQSAGINVKMLTIALAFISIIFLFGVIVTLRQKQQL